MGLLGPKPEVGAEVAGGSEVVRRKVIERLMLTITLGLIFVALYLDFGIWLVRPSSRGLVEHFDQSRRLAQPGFELGIVPKVGHGPPSERSP